MKDMNQRIIGISKEDNFSVAYKKNPYFNKIFSKEQEDTLFFNIKAMLDEHQLVTMNTISSIAKDLYYSPIFLATKAREIEDSQNKKNKTTFNELLNMATDEPEQLMNKYDIRQFVASKSWVFHYMVRHNLSLRKVHYERRGQIDEKQIDRYLNQIVEAVTEFGTDKIINMDETHVSTWNFPQRVVAEKGIETVKVDDNYYNDKEGTTFIAAISMNPSKKFPISLISKGKTQRCHKKYEINDKDTFISQSLSGWMTPDVMIEYLR